MADSEEQEIKTKIDNLWGIVLPELLLADTEAEFDEILNDFIARREAFGVEKLNTKQTELMNEAKAKLGIN